MDYQQICLDLIRADHESEVAGILAHHALDADQHWCPLGGIENNQSIVGNQQSCATAALVEKLVNSIDSLLLLECRRRGIDPESADAPLTMTSAAAQFFGMPEGGIHGLRPGDRGRLADNVQFVATGTKRDPSFTIIDVGEGQRPRDFNTTFCSLVRSNKLRVPFVQGKYNMGGCGTLPFCGNNHLQLIVSRRHPALVAGESGGQNTGWGFTLIRRRDPAHGRRSSSYEFLAPNGHVAWFQADHLPVRPSREQAYQQPLQWGTLIKLYNYQIEQRTAVVFDLSFELSRRLYQLPLPVRICERRDYRGHSRETILTGLSVRLQDDRAGLLEDGFPDSGIVHVESVGDAPVETIVFKRGQGKNFLPPQAAILFTVNGQVHGGLGRRFLCRDAVRLDFLKNDLLVVLNCTDIPARVREDLFMPSRDRLRECAAKVAFDHALESFLADHQELKRLNLQRREDELRGRLADDKPLTEALKSVIDSSPELKDLFGQGVQLPNSEEPGDTNEPFVGRKFPTFFRLATPPPDGETTIIDCPAGREGRVRFLTDAANDYFTRNEDPGTVTVFPTGLFSRILLRDGRAVLVLKPSETARPGMIFDVHVEVTDPSRQEPFGHILKLRMVDPRQKPDRPSSPPKHQASALALPKVIEVDETGWDDEGFGPESGLSMQRDVDGGLVAKVNVANDHLKRTLLRTPDADRDLMRKRFVYGLVLSGVSLWKEYAEEENEDELIRSATKAVARVLLPMILVLGSLEHELIAVS